MADSLEKDIEGALEVQGQEPVVVPETFKVGDKDYSQEELNRLVNLGNIATELESKWNTKIDKVYPAFTQSQTKLKDYEDKAKKYDELIAEQATPAVPQDQQVAEAKRILREQFGVILKEDVETLGFANKEDFKTLYKQEREAEKVLEQAQGMEETIDGSDGRPAFKAQDILAFASENKIPSLETAYKLKFEKELDAWKEGQLGKIKKPEFVTQEKATGGLRREPEQVKPKSEEELLKQLTESIYGPEEQ